LICSHLFQRVASFLLESIDAWLAVLNAEFSSLSESGFIPTKGMEYEIEEVED